MTGRPRIAVVGSGIGGLTLAAALAESGTPCEVFEQTRAMAEIGAGVQLAPNAACHLQRLGIGAALTQHAVPIEEMHMYGRRGDLITSTPFGAACERLYGAPYYAVHRADLQGALLRLVGPEPLRLGHRLTSVAADGDEQVLTFENGSTHRADLVVGADGIHSVIREELVRDAPVFSGLGVFRGLIPVDRLPDAAREPLIRMWLGPGRHLVCYPVSGGRLLSFAAIAPLAAATAESWSAQGDPAALIDAFDGWSGLVPDITRAADTVRRWALYDRPVLHTWSAGRLTVLGDAAHPMLPFMAQGANQAVEDAVELASLLAGAGTDEIPQRLRTYEQARAPRAAAIQQGSRGHSETMHLPDGPRQRERDQALRHAAGITGLRERAWLYGHEAGARPSQRAATAEERESAS
ncbi:FAD-dependent monooxygenase [Streptomyces sp. NBC_00006]|uniref:FAD-dependent monooxygenase n=1 Tax=unclassified Streptomyces TaxID=2593676 RepID=UPI002254362C|nr:MULTISPECIES: FAD-dependent monooxygenase [unclassified Streptomyces]MCX4834199.1 FAD-dependent monooxygenase [Streptomyces sp. NBC_01016]MCX5529890.1 FAD-dependent monooxygenase [Streptomyces sp. NBC_00006]